MPERSKLQTLTRLLGVDWSYSSHTERLVSGAGAFFGILLVFYISQRTLDTPAAGLLIASMGASAVLLFAIPHGALSQPWNLVVGHIVSAVIGVTAARFISPTLLAAAVAVGLAVLAQYYLRSLHPPGGATALTAVIGGQQVSDLGYQFVLTPVAINAIAIMLVAIVFNFIFSWRRYPVAWSTRPEKQGQQKVKVEDPRYPIKHEDLVYALSELDSFLDVTEDDLLHIYQLATHRSITPGISPDELKTGHYYSNEHQGAGWEVRQIVDWQQQNGDSGSGEDSPSEMLIYKSIDRHGVRGSGVSTRIQFAHWAKTEVIFKNNEWVSIVNE